MILDGMILGRDPDAAITLEGSDVSRHHAQIVVRPDGAVELVDLGSRNGTLVNGVRVQQHRLASGDRVRLGATVLVLSEGDRAMQPAARPEAVGTVAGRVVHGLNNAFTALANDLFFLDALPATTNFTDHEVRTCLQEMQDVVRNAGELSGQLLDVGRAGSVVVPVAHLLDEVGRLVRRARPMTVRVDLPPGEALTVCGERGPMLISLFDLCLAVGDALPEGDMITLRAISRVVSDANVDAFGVAEAGEHVEITVLSSVPGEAPRVLLPQVPNPDIDGLRTSTQKIFRAGNVTELLVVDGDRNVRASIRRAMHRLGVTVREAGQASAALAQLQHHLDVSVVLIDLELPDLPAAELVARLRALGRPLTIVIAAGREEAIRAAATGADDFLPKPFDPDALWVFLNDAARR